VNMERYNLCDMTLLNEICDTNKLLSKHHIQLVIEITERNYCQTCPEVMKGLLFLKHNNVLLAADDFVWWQDDFRCNEVAAGLYGIIKIENPIQWKKYEINACVDSRLEVFRAAIESMLEKQNLKIVIERIENEEEFVLLTGLPVSGFQGYLFGKHNLG
ncbi:EAL domain-containing protein, partial [Shewanella sp. MBTL60-007]|uniref:EAL domain-containing protein n=1 Tax=Shewanella sp. MBTL60-007 TaxID=2815911 RepID=UPI001C7F4AA7